MPDNEILLYQTEDGATQLQVRIGEETVWLSLNQIAELFQRDKSVISRHIKNVFEQGELTEGSVVAIFATTADDGKTYQVEHFNLDVIISVGYRVKSLRGTQFRRWATGQLREFLVKGFLLNDERFKEQGGGRDRENGPVLWASPATRPAHQASLKRKPSYRPQSRLVFPLRTITEAWTDGRLSRSPTLGPRGIRFEHETAVTCH